MDICNARLIQFGGRQSELDGNLVYKLLCCHIITIRGILMDDGLIADSPASTMVDIHPLVLLDEPLIIQVEINVVVLIDYLSTSLGCRLNQSLL